MYDKIILVGRLGKDPELRYSAKGNAVCKLSLASTDFRMKSEDNEDGTKWHNVVCFTKKAEFANKYLQKGTMIFVEGRIHYCSYETEEGEICKYTEIVVDEIKPLTGAKSKEEIEEREKAEKEQGEPSNEKQEQQQEGGEQQDDIPF